MFPKYILKILLSCPFSIQLRKYPTGFIVSRKHELNVSLFYAYKMLPDLDSNQDKQNQNLLYYHYTIGQSKNNFSA